MSFFTDFVIGRRSEAARILKTDNPTQKWPGFSWKSVTTLDVAEIYALLAARPRDVVKLDQEFEHLASSGEHGMVQLVPDGLIDRLVALDAVGAKATAKKLGKRRPFRGWSPEDLQALMSDLVDHAHKSRAAKKPLMMCMTGF